MFAIEFSFSSHEWCRGAKTSQSWVFTFFPIPYHPVYATSCFLVTYWSYGNRRFPLRVHQVPPTNISPLSSVVRKSLFPFVFDHFSQAHPVTEGKGNGVGLRLSVVRQLVELQGGRVKADNCGDGRINVYDQAPQ